tara:strand:- start:34 stop:282 length:249 start_codon:yes stop_codon:yes gene_type:complete
MLKKVAKYGVNKIIDIFRNRLDRRPGFKERRAPAFPQRKSDAIKINEEGGFPVSNKELHEFIESHQVKKVGKERRKQDRRKN